MFVDPSGNFSELSLLSFPINITNGVRNWFNYFSNKLYDSLDFIWENQDKIKYEFGRGLLIGWWAVSASATPVCISTTTVTWWCAIATSAGWPLMLICTAPAITAWTSCWTAAIWTGVAALGGSLMYSWEGGWEWKWWKNWGSWHNYNDDKPLGNSQFKKIINNSYYDDIHHFKREYWVDKRFDAYKNSSNWNIYFKRKPKYWESEAIETELFIK